MDLIVLRTRASIRPDLQKCQKQRNPWKRVVCIVKTQLERRRLYVYTLKGKRYSKFTIVLPTGIIAADVDDKGKASAGFYKNGSSNRTHLFFAKGGKFRKKATLSVKVEDISVGRFIAASNGKLCDGFTTLSTDGGLFTYNFHDKKLIEVGSPPQEKRELVTAVNSEMTN